MQSIESLLIPRTGRHAVTFDPAEIDAKSGGSSSSEWRIRPQRIGAHSGLSSFQLCTKDPGKRGRNCPFGNVRLIKDLQGTTG